MNSTNFPFPEGVMDVQHIEKGEELMKKLFLFTLLCLMVLSITACGRSEVRVAETSGEEITDETVDEEIEVDDPVSISDDEDEGIATTGTKWPTDMVAEHIPELNAGEVADVFNSPNACLLTVENVEKDKFDDYFNEIKEMGYVENPLDISQGESTHYYAENGEFGIQLTYDGETEEVGINFMRLEF